MAQHAQLHILAATACVLATGCAAYPTLQERSALLASAVQYYAPETAVPAPLVILVSGCGGLTGLQGPKQVMKTYAEAATSAGAYVAVKGSFAPRGISFEESVRTVCSGLRLHGNERAGDIIAAEALARNHWRIDFTGVILAGWSHGGWTVMELLSAGVDARDVGGFRIDRAAKALTPDAVALYYPYCGLLNATGRSRWDFKGPLLLLITDAEKACVEQVEDARRRRDRHRPLRRQHPRLRRGGPGTGLRVQIRPRSSGACKRTVPPFRQGSGRAARSSAYLTASPSACFGCAAPCSELRWICLSIAATYSAGLTLAPSTRSQCGHAITVAMTTAPPGPRASTLR